MLVGVASTVAGVLILQSLDGPSRTEVRIYAPSLAEGFAISHHSDAHCFGSIFAVTAYRCGAADGQLYDPCRPSADMGPEIFCAGSPWEPPVVVRNLGSPGGGLDGGPSKPRSFRKAFPWALELSNGRRCVFLTGATNVIAGKRVNYECRDKDHVFGALTEMRSPAREFVIGLPDRSTQPWVVSFFSPNDTATQEIRVHRAWF